MSRERGEVLSKSPESRQAEESDYYVRMILGMEKTFKNAGLNHRFVGGTFTDLLTPFTEVSIDIENRRINLANAKTPNPKRADGTTKDADVICFTEDKTAIRMFREEYKQIKIREKGYDRPFPYVSLEFANRTDWTPRKRWRQFVTTFDVDKKGTLSLNYRNIHQPISWESVEPWTVNFGPGEITIFNPYAHALCYALRVPSGVKKKDRKISEDGLRPDGVHRKYNKMSLLMGLANRVKEADLRHGLKYNEDFNPDLGQAGLYRDWIKYINELYKNPDLVTRTVAKGTDIYWDTIGERVAHGGGVILEWLAEHSPYTGG